MAATAAPTATAMPTSTTLNATTAASAHFASLALLAHAVAVAGIAQRAVAIGGPSPVTGRGFVGMLALRRRLTIMGRCPRSARGLGAL
ncbi:MAG: hypothetical protein ACREX5_01205, partial [Achromobacter pestifer]